MAVMPYLRAVCVEGFDLRTVLVILRVEGNPHIQRPVKVAIGHGVAEADLRHDPVNQPAKGPLLGGVGVIGLVRQPTEGRKKYFIPAA